MRRRKLLGALAGLPVGLPQMALAQLAPPQWPAAPVKMMVGFTAGNASDVIARVCSDELARATGTPFVVENRAGASGTLAIDAVVRGPADGQTLLFGNSSSVAVAPSLYKLRFDVAGEIEPVALVARAPLILVVRDDFPGANFRQFVARASDPARDLSFGSNGAGAMNHLAMELLKARSGARATHVPYKGGAQALNDLIGGSIDVMFEAAASALPHVRSGRLRPLAVTSPSRFADLPEVPTVAEFYPGFDAVTWAAFFVRAGTPRPVLARMNQIINQMMRVPAVKDRFSSAGTQPVDDSTAASAKEFWLADLARWTQLVKALGITIS